MKTLNKTLCLVLALVMVLGLFGVASAAGTTNANDFTDAKDIQYKVPVSVLVGVGAINGYDTNDFKPAGNVTRAEAAKLVVYTVLGKTLAETLPTGKSSFTDVADGNWATAPIEYLVGAGVINGRGDGTFDPYGQVTGYEIAKMMLVANGYGVNGEYTGAKWQLSVAIDAAKVGLFHGSKDTKFDDAATREEAALYCFNGIVYVNQVVWDKSKELYVPSTDTNGISFGTLAATTYGLKYDNSGVPTVGGTLELDNVAANTLGQPVTEWSYKDEKVCSAVETPVLTYTTEFVPAEAYKALKDKGYKFGDDFATSANGKDGAAQDSDAFAALTTKVSGNGTVVEFYANDSTKKITKMVTIGTNFLAVNTITADTASTAVDERAIEFINPLTGNKYVASAVKKTIGFDAVYTAMKALKDAGEDAGALVVISATDGATVLKASLPTSAELKIDVTKGDTTFTADGKTYEYAAGNTTWFDTNALVAGNTYTVYFDSYGYAVYAKLVDEAITAGIAVENGTKSTGYASEDIDTLRIVGSDATVTSYDVTADAAAEYSSPVAAGEYKIYDIVTRKLGTGVNKDKYVVTTIGKFAACDADSTDTNKATTKADITTGKVAFGVDVDKNTTIDADEMYNADSKTLFIIEKYNATTAKFEYKAYTGIKNVPTITACDGIAVYDAKNDGYQDIVFIKNAETKAAATDAIAFVAIDQAGGVVTDKDGKQYYDAGIITGAALTDIKQVKLTIAAAGKIASAKNPIISAYTEEDGFVTDVTPYADANKEAVAGYGITAAKNDNITIGGVAHTYTDNCMVWIIDGSKKVVTEKFTAGTKVTAIAADKNDQVFFVADQKTGEVSAIYIVKVDDSKMAFAADGTVVTAYDAAAKTATIKSGATVEQVQAVAAAMGCTATFEDNAAAAKTTGAILATDKMTITAADGKTKVTPIAITLG